MATQNLLTQVLDGLRQMDDDAVLAIRDEVNRQNFRADNPSGRCEDFPCCGHEAGDCDGSLYGSDERIKMEVERAWATGHGYCDHAEGIFNCDGADDDDEYDEED